MQKQDRRASGVKRVPVQTLVEICGRVPEVPAFEAQSIEVSGRGMHVRTRYLPPVGAPLVLRFEEAGHQILVEGEVAWAEDMDRGGEFGIRFTALDSGSVDALKKLCGIRAEQPEELDEEYEADAAEPEEAKRKRKAQGTRVRLHIDGLGSPMKAQVRRAGGRAMTVGSKLEFLKLGRHLDIEDLDAGDRSGAAIETVDVIIDPQSQVPQLVVSLAYDEPFEDVTPEPSVVDAQQGSMRECSDAELDDDELDEPGPDTRVAGTPERVAARSVASEFDDDELDDDPDFDSDYDGVEAEYDDEHEPSVLQAKLGSAASQAGEIAKNTGTALKHVGASAASKVGGWIKSARHKKAVKAEARGQTAPATRKQGAGRRVQGSPPSGVLSTDGRRLRPQSLRGSKLPPSRAARQEAASEAPPPRAKKLKRYGAIAGAAVMLTTVAVLAMRKPATPAGEEEALSKPVAAEETPLAPNEDVTNVDEQGNPIPANAANPQPQEDPQGKTTPNGISADVPLFGPTNMAPTEAAPVDEEAGASALDEPVDDTPPVADESWDDGGDKADSKPVAEKVDPKSVKPWGRGTVSRPTIHRIRLDGPGGAIQGAINPTGFVVVIPGRKVMESGGSIAKRDKRIARVKTSNGGSGAQITFQFKNGIPGYRVRLRKDFVEFLISEPKKGGALAKR
ncbi:MAG: PilZ domain-containing protein [Myxococcales bacterium]|nr:PilZ domain-containing protein [Myxococcales bacterium]